MCAWPLAKTFMDFMIWFLLDSVTFPAELMYYGLTLELLDDAIMAESEWTLRGIPNVEFYRKLHNFLKKWSKTHSLTKTCIGNFYLSIDVHLQERGSTPYNTYRFIDQLQSSNIPDTSLMSYGLDKKLQAEIHGCHEQYKDLSEKVQEQQTEIHGYYERYQGLSEKVLEQQTEIKELRSDFENTTDHLLIAKNALQEIAKEKSAVIKNRSALQRKLHKTENLWQDALSDLFSVEDELVEENTELCNEIACLKENGAQAESTTKVVSVETKDGKVFSTSIRHLYYALLCDQVPPGKIPRIVQSVLKCFVPSLDMDGIKLPQKRCAGYMRKDELKTISMAHKASTIVSGATLDLNTDGTTKFQKKIGGVAVNGMVLSLNEVPDGSADSVIEDISRELDKLRDIARVLNLSNPERINWTLFSSSTSDSAASQKRFNRLLQERRDDDEEKYGSAGTEATEFVENFCAMHLGSNLRKAFFKGIKEHFKIEETNACREYNPADVLIHEFCKLFGLNGVPEYGCGRSFGDFLQLKISECSPEESCYYQSCRQLSLERQVGSRYFVSAANATKILFLVNAAIEYLQYTGKDEGNKLECTVFKKLNDIELLATLKADSLMYYFVYSELVMLAKSEDLKKSAFDMNKHYLELQLFLEMVEEDPSTVMDRSYKVFISEERLYGDEKALNHRIRPKNTAVHSQLFHSNEWDASVLYPTLQAGATKMKEKLKNYAKNQLPGGIYWEPEPAVEEVLKRLRPNNDICESILGLNDYLTSALPNMHQQTRSNLVEVKKNCTMAWYDGLTSKNRDTITKLAVKRRKQVVEEYKEDDKKRSEKRQETMKQSYRKRQAFKAKELRQKEVLSQQHLIATVNELLEVLEEIDSESISPSRKKAKKIELLRTQINIRKKVLKQNINIVFSKARKQRPLADIVNDLKEFIADNPNHDPSLPTLPSSDPFSLVGKEINHRFILECGEEKWFRGFVLSYNANTNMHEVVYDGETDHQYFDLKEDIHNRDVEIFEL